MLIYLYGLQPSNGQATIILSLFSMQLETKIDDEHSLTTEF